MLNNKIKKIHFTGIGGIGMSGLARLLKFEGYEISGSDMNSSSLTDKLQLEGVKFYNKHSRENIKNIDLLVYTPAVSADNPELLIAKEKGITIVKRSDLLGEISNLRKSICIAGTHGKTTTSAMTGLVLESGELSPTIIVGGELSTFNGSNIKIGNGDYFVLEADEFDRTFLKLHPYSAVITNLELEHLDTYKDLKDIKKTFVQFANSISNNGSVYICTDEPNVKDIKVQITKNVVTYGTGENADILAKNISHQKFKTFFDVVYKNEFVGNIELSIPGLHNIKNSLAAIGVGLDLGIDFENIKQTLKLFTGVNRRFEVKYNNKVTIIDDYAHHPTEIIATLKGIKDGFNRRVIAIFQPHLYSRTRDFYQEFAAAFLLADVFICMEIYPAREKPIEGVTGEMIANYAVALGHKNTIYESDKNKIPEIVRRICKDDDIIFTMGAGDINQIINPIISLLKNA
ncbi:MAG: UDP-N-acetylmuramate--L-alanine ligase [Ignavibacteriales bacterium]|nr:UDP-N-acetylmuramate--L-alanine ligase [Ignavibacteriales bacterium]